MPDATGEARAAGHMRGVPDERTRVMLVVSLLGVGGAERHMATLANELSARHRVVLVYVKDDATLLHHVDIGRLDKVACLKSRSGLDIGAVRRLAALMDELRPAVVICANTYPLIYAQLARLRSRHRARVVEVFHTTVLQSWTQRLHMLACQPLFWMAQHLVFVCQAQRDYWRRRRMWAPRQSVIYNGVDTRRFEPDAHQAEAAARRAEYGFAENDLVVGICAVMRPEKAHKDLLEAMATGGDEVRRWKALFIGDGPMRPEIERDIERLGLADRVHITGYRSDVRGDLAACNAVALVSVAIETFSIAALEAMAMGKPLIMSDIGGAREQVVHGVTGWLFAPHDTAGLAVILRQAGDASLLASMGRKARELVLRDYSLPRMIERYESLILAESVA